MSVVETAYVGALGVDTDTKLDATSAARLRAWGMKFAIRYVSLGEESQQDLTAIEVEEILGAGLALMAVQHVRIPGWLPTGILGASDGTHAAHNAVAANLPAGVSLALDLEGVASGAATRDTLAYCEAWALGVKAAGFDPLLYVGGACGLTGDELFSLRGFSRYWRSQSVVPEVTRRGCCMIQLFPSVTVAGVSVDVDVVQKDYLGGMPCWVVSAPHATTLPADDTLDEDTPAIA